MYIRKVSCIVFYKYKVCPNMHLQTHQLIFHTELVYYIVQKLEAQKLSNATKFYNIMRCVILKKWVKLLD